MDRADDERRTEVLDSVELPDGTTSGGRLVTADGEQVLRIYTEKEVEAGGEVELPGDRYFRVTDVRRRSLDDLPVTDLEVEGPHLRRLDGHSLGDGWPQRYWRELAAECREHGFARPVVRFLELLAELRTCDQVGLARAQMRSLSAEHLATATGQVGGALLDLRRIDAPAEVAARVSSLYRAMLEEMSERWEAGEYLQPPDPAARVRFGPRKPDGWRDFHDWADLIS